MNNQPKTIIPKMSKEDLLDRLRGTIRIYNQFYTPPDELLLEFIGIPEVSKAYREAKEEEDAWD